MRILARRKRPNSTGVWLGAAIALAGGALVRWQLQGRFTEEPDYQVLKREGPFEIRTYAPVIRAETTVEAPSWREGLNSGFRRLAGYIFGHNTTRQRIAMTAPVTQREAIAMTGPIGGTHAADPSGPWTTSFTMPKARSLASLPRPDDARVVLREVPERTIAALRFAGRYSAERVAAKAQQLIETVTAAGLEPRGKVEFAGYDPPTTLPLLRRNEVWVELWSSGVSNGLRLVGQGLR